MTDSSLVAGWLTKDLEAAVNEVKNWPEGMRRGISSDEIDKPRQRAAVTAAVNRQITRK